MLSLVFPTSLSPLSEVFALYVSFFCLNLFHYIGSLLKLPSAFFTSVLYLTVWLTAKWLCLNKRKQEEVVRITPVMCVCVFSGNKGCGVGKEQSPTHTFGKIWGRSMEEACSLVSRACQVLWNLPLSRSPPIWNEIIWEWCWKIAQ